jgi:hypothetical protein
MQRNTLVGIGFLLMGSILAGGSALIILLRRFYTSSGVSVAEFGLALAVIGALIVTLVPGWQAAPQDAFKGLLRDSIKNVEVILEESGLRNRAYFMKMADGDVRAFVPTSFFVEGPKSSKIVEDQPALDVTPLYDGPQRFVVDYKGLRGMLLTSPGNEIVKLAKVEEGTDLEEALRSTLVDYADLAEGVLAIEEDGGRTTKIQITKPRLSLESPYFIDSLGSPVSCVAASVVAVAKGKPVRFVKEKYYPDSIQLTLESVQTYLPTQS